MDDNSKDPKPITISRIIKLIRTAYPDLSDDPDSVLHDLIQILESLASFLKAALEGPDLHAEIQKLVD